MAVVTAFLLVVIGFLLRAVALMTAFHVLHGLAPAVPAAGIVDSCVLVVCHAILTLEVKLHARR